MPSSQASSIHPELIIEPSNPEREQARKVEPISLHLELASELSGLPKDLGLILIGLGTVGVAIPGPIPPGISFVILGAIVLCPGLIKRLGWLARSFPGAFRLLTSLVKRLRADLKRRYPGPVAT